MHHCENILSWYLEQRSLMLNPLSPALSPGRTPYFRLGAVLLGLILGAVASLGLLKLRATLFPSTQWLYLYELGYEKTGHRFIHDERLGWRNIPNWTGTTFGEPLSINSQGLRDREYSIEKPNGKQRMLILGDSYAWGYGVRNNQIFSCGSDQRVEKEMLLPNR